MVGELEKKKAEFAEERHLALEEYEATLRNKQAESDAALHASQTERNDAVHAERAQSTQQKTMLDAKWATWVKLLQEDQAQKQKDANDGLVHRIAKLQQQ